VNTHCVRTTLAYRYFLVVVLLPDSARFLQETPVISFPFMTGSQPFQKLLSLPAIDRMACVKKTMALQSFHCLACLVINLDLKLKERHEMTRRTVTGETTVKKKCNTPSRLSLMSTYQVRAFIQYICRTFQLLLLGHDEFFLLCRRVCI
jgi:hypothetical protein